MEPQQQEEPTEAMVRAFESRTALHVRLVTANLERLSTKRIELREELLDRGRVHDASKWSEPERTPYVWLTEYHRVHNSSRSKGGEGEVVFRYPSGVGDAVEAAIKHHKANNRHHSEFFADPDEMSTVDVLEMVSDWAAIAQELSNNPRESPRHWFDETGRRKWNYSAALLSRIEEAISELEETIKQEQHAT